MRFSSWRQTRHHSSLAQFSQSTAGTWLSRAQQPQTPSKVKSAISERRTSLVGVALFRRPDRDETPVFLTRILAVVQEAVSWLQLADVADGLERAVECNIARIDLALVELSASAVRLDHCAAAHRCLAAFFNSCKSPCPARCQYRAAEGRRIENFGQFERGADRVGVNLKPESRVACSTPQPRCASRRRLLQSCQ
jgi:hypothetical protein